MRRKRSWIYFVAGICAACADPEDPMPLPDAQPSDTGVRDVGADAGARDLGFSDLGVVDSGPTDGGSTDAIPDTGPAPDAGADAGSEDVVDAGAPDADVDTGVQDVGPGDGAVDGGSQDAGPMILTLDNPTATFSQTQFGAFSVARAFDGAVGGLGWAIHPLEGYQAAVVETSLDTPAFPNGTRIIFALDQTYPVEHGLGRFRLSYTTVPRTNFADGNDGSATPGDVGDPTDWTVLTPVNVLASNGATLTVQADSSILAEDLDSTDAIYVVVAEIAGGGITGFRLEVMEDPSLPLDGPGLQDSDGNFVLSEMSIVIEAR